MRDFLLWLDDHRSPHRGKLTSVVVALVLVGVGALLGLAVGAPGKGAVVAACAASVLAIGLPMASCHAGGRSRHETPMEHLERAFSPAAAAVRQPERVPSRRG